MAPRHIWTEEEIEAFLECCHMGVGNNIKRPGEGWKTRGWRWLAKQMLRFGFQFSPKQLKNKWDAMAREYREWKRLVHGKMGFGWNAEANMIDANDDRWAQKVQQDPKFANLRLKACSKQRMELYGLLFDGDSAYSHHARQSHGSGNSGSSASREGSGDSEEDWFNDPQLQDLNRRHKAVNVERLLEADKIPCQIEDGLFLGSVRAAKNKNGMKSKNITHILTVAHSISPVYPSDFVYKVVSVVDKEDTNLRQHFDECFNFIDQAKIKGGSALVHCYAGRSRSASIVIAYLMKKRSMSLSEALEHVKSRCPKVAPNSGFMSQLREFEKCIQGIHSISSQNVAN